MKPSVYIETSIPSFYYEVRTEPDMVARREWTREWWNDHLVNYDAYTSEAVIEELEGGVFPGKKDALKREFSFILGVMQPYCRDFFL